MTQRTERRVDALSKERIVAAAIAVAAASSAGGLMSLFRFQSALGSRFELLATTIGLAWIVVFGVTLVVGSRGRASATHGQQQLIGEVDEPVDLVVVPVDPARLGLGADRNERVVLLPDDESAVGT